MADAIFVVAFVALFDMGVELRISRRARDRVDSTRKPEAITSQPPHGVFRFMFVQLVCWVCCTTCCMSAAAGESP